MEAVAELIRRPRLPVARLERRQPPLGGVGGLRRHLLGCRPRRRVHRRRRHGRPRPGEGLHGRPARVGHHPHPDRVPWILGTCISAKKKKKLPHFILFLAEGLGFVMGLLPLVHR